MEKGPKSPPIYVLVQTSDQRWFRPLHVCLGQSLKDWFFVQKANIRNLHSYQTSRRIAKHKLHKGRSSQMMEIGVPIRRTMFIDDWPIKDCNKKIAEGLEVGTWRGTSTHHPKSNKRKRS